MLFWRKFDLVGIVLQVLGSNAPPFYYGFYCEESTPYRHFYLKISWIVCLASGALVLLPLGFKKKHQSYICAAAFIAAGWSCCPGIMHMCFYRDPKLMYEFQLWPWLAGGMSYSIGACIYARKQPERTWVGCFDYFGNSHQIFHLSILFGAVIHFYSSLKEFHKRQLYPCPEHYLFPLP